MPRRKNDPNKIETPAVKKSKNDNIDSLAETEDSETSVVRLFKQYWNV